MAHAPTRRVDLAWCARGGNVAPNDGANGTDASSADTLSLPAGLMRFTARQRAVSVHIDSAVRCLLPKQRCGAVLRMAPQVKSSAKWPPQRRQLVHNLYRPNRGMIHLAARLRSRAVQGIDREAAAQGIFCARGNGPSARGGIQMPGRS
jgi:hypothetical protein